MDELIIDEDIKNKIYTIRGMQVMIDRDLAKLYGVETKVFNQAVKRNIERFPQQFRIQITEEEYQNLSSQFMTSSSNDSLRSQIVTLESQRGKHRKYLPYVFTEQGVSMLSAILKSKIAIEISIKIINNFVNMRKIILNNSLIDQKLDNLERKHLRNGLSE
ncbi:MAG: ORF6N domain-containing protein [Arcobacter sp.]|nr:ORF6N domain-containing protein [Arcobacter sp.]